MLQVSVLPRMIFNVRWARVFVAALFLICLAATQAAAQTTFSNSAPITIPASGAANPYPSEIVVSGLPAGQSVSKVTVSVNNFTHNFPADVGILLVSPAGVAVNLEAGCGGSSPVTNATLTFDDQAASELPIPLVTGTYRPSQCDFVSYPQTGAAPPPAAPYNNSLRAFNTGAANGTWRLYVFDAVAPDGGTISGGYSITITTAVAAPRTFTVNTNLDNETDGCAVGLCTLREAVNDANSNLGNDTITFQRAFFTQPRTITLGGTELAVIFSGSLTIDNTGSSLVTVSGNNTSRILLNDGVTTVNRLVFTGGNGNGTTTIDTGGAIYNSNALTLNQSQVNGNTADGNGGGIFNQRIITLNNSTVSNNSATGINGFGGGTASSSTVDTTVATIVGSTFFNNQAAGVGTGGAIDNIGALNITNSTFSGNSTINGGGNGGAIWTQQGAVSIVNSTVAGNTTAGSNSASGIFRDTGVVTLRNTIVAGNVNNTAFPDVFSNAVPGTFVSGGNNLIGNPGAVTTFVNGTNGDQTGNAGAPLNPLLAPLSLNGGSTFTRALLGGSTAINAGNNAAGTTLLDQRGASRSGAIDIGAVESNPAFVAALPFGRRTVVYGVTITPDTGSFVYTLTAGALPPGLSLSTSPVVAISGTPTQDGTFNFTLSYTDGVNSGSTNYTITVAAATAANVSIGGRVLTPAGRGLRGAIVVLTDERGQTRSASTSSFGLYRFTEVAAGATYIIQVHSKQFSFEPHVITVTADTDNVDFTAEP